ncbi:MAG: hypothetical protein J0H12_04500 [Candidatus Paracaedimonas acanthamoebae]|uniref:Uncharacterized protein n=1 Tax=Candidatus Paracaedimonas acanthamoebae TaxID=244581 RepID=A0A8J7TUW3_9PROT|nr:hypothetical protein [Candidatus Paracaedimonas acanthamoebae]
MQYFWPILLILLFPLGGCQNSQPLENHSCFAPTTNIIHQLSRQSFFDPTSAHEVARLEIESLKEVAEKDKEEALLSFQIVFGALRNTTISKLNGNYFIAITDQEGIPLFKKIFPLEILFEGKKKYQRKVKEVTIPVSLNIIDHCEKYQIFIGFDLKTDDLEHSLRRLEQKTS